MTAVSSKQLDAFDQWCLCYIIRIAYIAHVINDEVWHRTNQPTTSHLYYNGKTTAFVWPHAPSDPLKDHSCALQAANNCPPAKWHRQTS